MSELSTRQVEHILARYGSVELYDNDPEQFDAEHDPNDPYAYYEGHYWGELSEMRRETDVPGLGKVTVVDNYGGEGQGDDLWAVFRIEFDNGDVKHYRKSGYWVSYDGATWDQALEEVTPREKVITVWH